MTLVTGTFEVGAGAIGKAQMDITGLAPDQIAERFVSESDVDTGLCWSCSDKVIEPEVGDLVSFTVDGVDYVRQGEHWVEATR